MELATLSTFDTVFPGMSPQDVALNCAQAFRSRERAWILGLRLFMHTAFIHNQNKDSCYLHTSQVYESRSFITTSSETARIHGYSGIRCHRIHFLEPLSRLTLDASKLVFSSGMTNVEACSRISSNPQGWIGADCPWCPFTSRHFCPKETLLSWFVQLGWLKSTTTLGTKKVAETMFLGGSSNVVIILSHTHKSPSTSI